MLQPLYLKNITVYPGDQTQSIDAVANFQISRLISNVMGSNRDLASGSETKGKFLMCNVLTVYLVFNKLRVKHN